MINKQNTPRNRGILFIGGSGRIRTSEALSDLPVFETGTFDHSVTLPLSGIVYKFLEIIQRSIYTNLIRAYSKMVLRLHGMEEVGVRFSLGPQYEKNTVAR